MIQIAMCIDDDPIVLMLNDLILKEQSFCGILIKYDRAESALEYFDEQSKLPKEEQELPSLIFLDINMPVMDGWEFLDIFDQLPENKTKDCKIIMHTSSIDPRDIEKAKTYKAVVDYMTKPLNLQSLSKIFQS